MISLSAQQHKTHHTVHTPEKSLQRAKKYKIKSLWIIITGLPLLHIRANKRDRTNEIESAKEHTQLRVEIRGRRC